VDYCDIVGRLAIPLTVRRGGEWIVFYRAPRSSRVIRDGAVVLSQKLGGTYAIPTQDSRRLSVARLLLHEPTPSSLIHIFIDLWT
jgi:hypothetical protein